MVPEKPGKLVTLLLLLCRVGFLYGCDAPSWGLPAEGAHLVTAALLFDLF